MAIDPALPASLAAELADLKRRMSNMERSPQLPFSSSNGLVISSTPLPMDVVLTLTNVTSALFTDLYEGRFDRPPGAVYVAECQILCPAGTTGELRVHDYQSGQSTDAMSLDNAITGLYIRFEWLHPAVVGANDPDEGVTQSRYFHPSIQARRTGGAGNVSVLLPYTSYFTSVRYAPDADTAGNPQAV